jgi:ribose transport system substrate-binding protein
MSSIRKAIVGAAALAFVAGIASTASAAEMFKGIDLAPDKVGVVGDLQDMSKYCGTKPIKVAYSDGWGANYWRQIARREFENEAKKCSNITEVRYTDGKGSDGWPSAEKQIADIQGLIAQKFDVIIVFADTGEAQLKVLKQATDAGIAVVPYSTGDHPFGKIGEDYLTRVTETQIALGKTEAEWMAKTLGGKGNVIVHGGTEGNPMTASQAVGWKEVFKKYPDIKVLEGPVTTNWDPQLAQQVMADAITKYGQIDGVIAETTGPIQAFLAAGKPVPAFFGQNLNILSCLWQDNHEKNPTFKMASSSVNTWLARLALRKGVAAVQGIPNDEPSIIELALFEDSTSTDPKLAVKCDKDLPATAIPSAMVPTAEQKEVLGQ